MNPAGGQARSKSVIDGVSRGEAGSGDRLLFQRLVGEALREHESATIVPTAYEGFGANMADCVVDGLKIYVSQVVLEGIDETLAAPLFDWFDDPRELEIGAGFAGVIAEEANIPPGRYGSLAITLDARFAIKAWAFLDTDGDGEADATVWTTAEGIELGPTKITSTDDLPGYDYREYPYIYVGSADSPEGPNPPEGEATFFPVPLEIGEGYTYVYLDGEVVEPPDILPLDLRVDNFRQPKMWNGEAGTGSELPDTFGGWPEFFPEGEPHLWLPYLPLYGLFDAAEIVAQTYEFSDLEDLPYGYSQIFSVIATGDGKPLFGRNSGPTNAFQLNQFFTEFEETEAGVYTFNVRENNYPPLVPETVQHIVSGFSPMEAGGDPLPVTVSPGPACPSGCEVITAYIRRIERTD